jgi:hypothetical protein
VTYKSRVARTRADFAASYERTPPWFKVEVSQDNEYSFSLDFPKMTAYRVRELIVHLVGLKVDDLKLGKYSGEVIRDNWRYKLYRFDKQGYEAYICIEYEGKDYTFIQRNVMAAVRRARYR